MHATRATPASWVKKAIVSLFLFFCIFTHPAAYASIAGTVPWSGMSAFDLDAVFKSHYGSDHNLYDPVIPPGTHAAALVDADNRVSEEFSLRAPMKDSVGFWLRIYTEWTTRHAVIYDRTHPDLIYEVMDFRKLHNESRNRMVYEIVRENRINKRLKEYSAAFARLAKIKNPRAKGVKLTALEKNILSVLSKTEHKHSMKEWKRGLRLQSGQRDNIVKGLLAAETFFPKMEEIFISLGLPKELTRIPLVESSFNLYAHSRAGAKGVWQFMPKSGHEYLFIDEKHGVDERLSPLKATIAAAKLLKRNLSMTGNWPLAVTAYNHGFTGIKKLTPSERASALTGELFQPCAKKKHLGYASSNYYAEFIALLHAEAYKDFFYGGSPLPIAPRLTFHKVLKPETPKAYAIRNGVKIKDFMLYNPDIKFAHKPLPKGLYVAVPGHEGDIDELISVIRPKLRPLKKSRRVIAKRR